MRDDKGWMKVGRRTLLGGMANITEEPFGSLDSETPWQYTHGGTWVPINFFSIINI